MSEKFYLAVLRGGVAAAFIMLFFVFGNLLFPFITSKQIPFNLLIEALTLIWLSFLIKYPNWSPFRLNSDGWKSQWLNMSLGAFFFVLLISCFTGVDFNLSFWGDIERMLGVFHLFHFLFYYFIIITVFREEKHWLFLLNAAVIAGVIQVFATFFSVMTPNGPLFTQKAYGQLGNTSYLSGQMIFSIYFALLLATKTKNWWLRSAYALAIIFMFVGMKNAATRGAYIGVIVSVFVLLFSLAVVSRKKFVRYGSIGLVVALVLFIFIIYKNADQPWVKGNLLFVRITQINFSAGTFQTRLLSWKAGMNDLPNHWLLGTGYGNFAISFDKYLDAKFFNISPNETYFDHAHNNVIDILSTVGILGLATYLLIFVVVVYYLWLARRDGRLDWLEYVLLLCLLIAYFIQNIVLFDSFVTYLLLMVVFGYVYWRGVSSKEQMLHIPPKFSIKGDLAQFGAVLIITAVILFVAYEYNIKVFRMLDSTISSYRTLQTGDLNKVVEQYKKALSDNTPLDRDSRNSFVQMILEQGGQVAKLPIDQARAIVDFAIAMSNKNLDLNQKDSLALLTNAQINYFAATLPFKDRNVSSKYFEVASSSINRAIQASPNRPPQYFVKANMLLSQNKRDEAIIALKRAIEINPTFGDSYCQLARVKYITKANKEGDTLTDQCIEFGGAYGMGNPQLLVELASKYVKQDRLDLAIKAIIGAVNLQPEARLYAMLADLYRRNNEFANAKAAALQAISLDPSIKASAEEFIKTLR